jgi:N-methylhydantoinase A
VLISKKSIIISVRIKNAVLSLPMNRDKKDKKIRIGIDTGGTFTDFIIFDGQNIRVHKILSNPPDPAKAIMKGLQEIGLDKDEMEIIHGSTVATNALLERKGAKVAFITTAGFEDLLFLARQTRKELYNLFVPIEKPLIPRELCIGIHERILYNGEIAQPLEKKEIEQHIPRLKKKGVHSVALCLLHSYANSKHEDIIQDLLTTAGFNVSASYQILPEYREYERASTTAINAYVSPIMRSYLKKIYEKLPEADLKIMQSNGGSISAQTAMEESIRTILSGPAGGVVGAFEIARLTGYDNIITFDMGGTSTDVCLCPGRLSLTSESIIGGYPIKIPMINIHTVGAGGGSIAYLDEGRALRVGPQSAGADPGPICYGKGKEVTVTDANLLLGRLHPDLFLGGKMKLHLPPAVEGMKKLALALNKDIYQLAEGIIEVANTNMERAIRVISVEKGYDPRDFTLVSFGGAGGMHAAELAARLGIPRIIVPENAGILSALGMLLSDTIKDYSRTVLIKAQEYSLEKIEELMHPLIQRGSQEMKREGFQEDELTFLKSLDLRYIGQSFELTIPFRKNFLTVFHQTHQQRYGYCNKEKGIEIVNLRLKVIGQRKKPRLRKGVKTKKKAPSMYEKRDMIFNGKRYKGVIYVRKDLRPGDYLHGPSLIIDFGSTTVLPPGLSCTVDIFMNLIIERSLSSPEV